MKTAEEWNSKFDWVGNHSKEIRAIQADALRHAMHLCAGVSMNCGQLKEVAIRDCIKVIEAEAAKLEDTLGHREELRA